MTRLLIAAYLIEAGLLLVVSPWTVWWRRNFFADVLPWVRPLMASGYVQGIVVAAGVATAIAGINELRLALFWKFSRRPTSPATTPPDA